MKVTDINIRILEGDSYKNLKALATIIIDDSIAIHNIKIIDGKEGLFISFPSIKTGEGKYYDIVHPITQTAREVIMNQVINKYEEKKRG